ncbi:MAG TPA: hypothetical protein PLD12_12215 [Bacteroidales bacterium]|nr:hypothetical protein [Bacteroidales bacterium]HOK99892.1 hypothetical protein [Bacteroidales bacterium]HPO66245.1 hypothetical protein [Bacteroidales bacterium]
MKEEIKNILCQPQQFSSDYLPQLQKVVEEFPYFQPAYFFLLKFHKQQSYAKYTESIERYIWHIHNRQLLYDFLNDVHSFESRGTDKTITSAEKDVTVETSSSPKSFTVANRRDSESLQESLSETLSQATQVDVSEEFEKKILPDIQFELDESIEIIKPSEEYEDFSLLEPSVSDQENDKDNVLELDEISTTSSVTLEETSPAIAVEDSTPQVQEANEAAPSSNSFGKKTNMQFSLIDEFLEKLPHIKPQPVPETAPVTDISQNSVEVHDDFMTETFARILVKQGSYDRAIEIYRKLILKFPEKNTYFASQIEEIEKLKNNPKP